MLNVTEKSTAKITLKGSYFKNIDGVVKGHDQWVTEKSVFNQHHHSLAVNQLIIKWEDKLDENFNRPKRVHEREILFSLYCKNCETSQNPNGEILVHTANRIETVTTIDLEKNMTLDRLRFFPISRNPADKNSDLNMIEFELKPLFPDQQLPISNAYIRYCLK